MGKCIECKKIDASYCGLNGGKRHWCRGCAQNLGKGTITRYKMERLNKETKKTGMAMAQHSTPKKRTLDSTTTISFATLGSKPAIAASLEGNWLERRLSAATLLHEAPRSAWSANTRTKLDFTTGTIREKIAINIGAELCTDYDGMALVMSKIAHVLNFNDTACIGANRVGNHTPKHQHTPLGTLSLLGSGTKRWSLWPPEEPAAKPIIMNQVAGQLFWIPPGWFHEVLTTGGEAVGPEDVIAPHWVCWCLPRHQALRSLCAFLVGTTKEKQCVRPFTPTQKQAVYKILTAYAENGSPGYA